jgi:PAS domain S-box-containing protein
MTLDNTTLGAIAGLVTALTGILIAYYNRQKNKSSAKLDKFDFLFKERERELARCREDNTSLRLELEKSQAQRDTYLAQRAQLVSQMQLLRMSRSASQLPELVVGNDGEVLSFNRQFQELMGITHTELVGKREEAVYASEESAKASRLRDQQVIKTAEVVYSFEHYGGREFVVVRYAITAGLAPFAVNRVLLDFDKLKTLANGR